MIRISPSQPGVEYHFEAWTSARLMAPVAWGLGGYHNITLSLDTCPTAIEEGYAIIRDQQHL
jgi:hypothetical protein